MIIPSASPTTHGVDLANIDTRVQQKLQPTPRILIAELLYHMVHTSQITPLELPDPDHR